MLNEHWVRWIKASCTKHFDDNRGSLPMDFEGAERVEAVDQEDYCEFRFGGPYFHELGSDEYKIRVICNVLIHHVKATDANFYTPAINEGIITKAFSESIPVHKYGTGADDDDSLIGCLSREKEIRVNNFGQIQKGSRVVQSTVEADYEIYLRSE